MQRYYLLTSNQEKKEKEHYPKGSEEVYKYKNNWMQEAISAAKERVIADVRQNLSSPLKLVPEPKGGKGGRRKGRTQAAARSQHAKCESVRIESLRGGALGTMEPLTARTQ